MDERLRIPIVLASALLAAWYLRAAMAAEREVEQQRSLGVGADELPAIRHYGRMAGLAALLGTAAITAGARLLTRETWWAIPLIYLGARIAVAASVIAARRIGGRDQGG